MYEKEGFNLKEWLRDIQIVDPPENSLDNFLNSVSDGYHTFGSLYFQRMILFATLVNTYSDISWKSLKHEDGTMYEGYFIVGMDTPQGPFTYHYGLQFYHLFECKELEFGKHWDGHTEDDITRLLTLPILLGENDETGFDCRHDVE